ncbi:MAG: hypothetical protein AB1705_04775 [Verrucomicrobiota bacterium]
MDRKKLDQLIVQLENYVECWKQFNHYITLARSKKFGPEDENQFLEIKSVITQELEIILSEIESGAPSKDDVHTLIGGAPSIRYLSELPDGSLRGIENQWHKSYIAWQSILGQLKVLQRKQEGQSGWKSFFGKK